jgi:hypothetical protein
MRVTRNAVLLSAIAVFAAACGREEIPPPDKLDDLTWLDTLTFPAQRAAVASELELGFMPDEEPGYEEPAPAPAPRPVAQRTSAPRQASPAPVYRAPAPAPAPAPARTQSNAKRDAAIGAVGGAVVGAAVAGGGNRVRGAIIGGAAGAVIGGVIGHTVNRKPVPNHFQLN